MSSELATAPVTPGFHRATSALSEVLGVEPRMMVDTIKKQCFPGMRAEDVSDAQLAAFISVANALKLNPLIPGMLYAYPGKNGGIVPVTGPDGVLMKLDENISDGKLEGYECTVFPEDVTVKPTHAVAKIFRKGSDKPAMFTAIFAEWSVGSNPNWSTRPRHMIWLRAIKQCARQVIHGVPYDEDDIRIGNMVDVTPEPVTAAPERPAPPPRQKKGAATVAENPAKTTPPVDKGKVVEGEFTDQKPEPSALENAAIAQGVATAKQLLADKAAEEADAARIATQQKAAENPAPAAPRAFLKDAEEITATCKVKSAACLVANVAGKLTPSVQAEVTGDFNGVVYQWGGATEGPAPDKILTAGPLWVAGGAVVLKLRGKLNTKSGKVLVTADSVSGVEPAASAMEVE